MAQDNTTPVEMDDSLDDGDASSDHADINAINPPLLEAGKWPRDLEIELFNAMCTHKPVGVSRHFEIVGIYRHLLPRYPTITITDIWDHLNQLYNLSLLEERNEQEEEEPFLTLSTPAKGKSFVEFSLPKDVTDLESKPSSKQNVSSPLVDVSARASRSRETKPKERDSKKRGRPTKATPKKRR
eukprot:m.81055 g.81055  ORF g.81055 m.81055 type:complete len:184 (+) comp25379_c0_seq2:148-699(+)